MWNVKCKFRKKKMIWRDCRKIKTIETGIRSSDARARWVEEGEKNTKYFCNLEKRNYTKKNITRLKIGYTLIDNPKEIREETKQFYEKLFTSENHNVNEYKQKYQHFGSW